MKAFLFDKNEANNCSSVLSWNFCGFLLNPQLGLLLAKAAYCTLNFPDMLSQLKLAVKKQFARLRFRLSAANNPLFIGFYRHFYSPKPGSLSEFLNAYSLARQGNFYVVQIGANDGISNDPIHKFIKRDGWAGVLLEPQPFVYNTFLHHIYRRNPGIHTLCAALGEEDGSRELYQIGFSRMRWATGLATFDRPSLERAFKNGFIASRCEKYGVEMPDSPEEQIIAEVVEVISPKTLLNRYELPRIDLLQIDTEGFDYQVIRMFDVASTQPQAIVYEHIHLPKEDAAACEALLAANGYRLRHFGANTLALSKSVEGFDEFLGADS